ncbi:MAG: FAD binding domain-containing protein [Candidatus Dormibacteria bacterium]
MKPPPFAYRAPESLGEALSLLAEHGDEAKVLAGGQSLVPLLNLRLARPALLVDLARVPGLAGVDQRAGGLALGSMARERTLERSELVRRLAPLLSAALPFIGHPAIRSQGTLGGSLAHADPAAELPAVAAALDAEMVAVSAGRGERTVAAKDFFSGYLSTALEPDEILTEVRIPPFPSGMGVSFMEVARRHGDFAMVGVAAAVRLEAGNIAEARLALTGVADAPVRAVDAERSLLGAAPDAVSFAGAAQAVAQRLAPRSDLHGSADYRREVAGALVRRALAAASQRAAAHNLQGDLEEGAIP